MNRYQRPRSVPHCPSPCPMILSYLRSASRLCVRVFTLRSNVRAVVPFVRQSLICQRKLSSRVQNVTRNAAFSCSAPGSQQEVSLSIRFIVLSQRGGMANPIVHKGIAKRSAMIPVRHNTHFPLETKFQERLYKPRQVTCFTV